MNIILEAKGNKVFSNAGWLIFGKIVQTVLAFLIGIFTARFLGPSNYGLINYAASITTFVLPVVQLGLNAVLVYELVNNKDEEGQIIGTALTMTVLSAVISILGIFTFSLITNFGEKETIIVCALYSSSLIFQALELIVYWFQSKFLSKYTAFVTIIAYVCVSAYRIFLLTTGKSIYWFCMAQSLDYFIISILLLFLYKKLGGKKLSFSFKVSKRLLAQGKYYILSGIMINIFAQTDRIMLKSMCGNSSVGLYSAAITIAGLSSFVFSALIDSFRPYVLENKNKSKESYEKSIINMYSVIIWGALISSFAIFLLAGIIVRILYGTEYLESVSILRIIVWYTAFSYFGGAKDVWILAEGKQKYLLILNICGAGFNIVFNLMLIPYFGASGAAFASLITQIFTNIIMCFVIKELRYNIKLLLRSLNPINLFNIIKEIVSFKNK